MNRLELLAPPFVSRQKVGKRKYDSFRNIAKGQQCRASRRMRRRAHDVLIECPRVPLFTQGQLLYARRRHGADSESRVFVLMTIEIQRSANRRLHKRRPSDVMHRTLALRSVSRSLRRRALSGAAYQQPRYLREICRSFHKINASKNSGDLRRPFIIFNEHFILCKKYVL